MDTLYVIDFEGNKRLGVWEYGIVTLSNFADIIECKYVPCKGEFSNKSGEFFAKRKKGLFCSHSMATEDGLLRHYWASPGKVPLFYRPGDTLRWGPWIDTKMIYRKLFPGLLGYELHQLVDIFGLHELLDVYAARYCPVDARKFHSALFDALAASLLLKHLTKFYTNISLEKLVLLSN